MHMDELLHRYNQPAGKTEPRRRRRQMASSLLTKLVSLVWLALGLSPVNAQRSTRFTPFPITTIQKDIGCTTYPTISELARMVARIRPAATSAGSNDAEAEVTQKIRDVSEALMFDQRIGNADRELAPIIHDAI